MTYPIQTKPFYQLFLFRMIRMHACTRSVCCGKVHNVQQTTKIKQKHRLRNSSGKLVLGEKEMAKITREHFKRNAQGTTGFHSEGNGQPEFERQQRVKLEVEEYEKLEEPFSSLEVVRALKRMKGGKGVGIDKVSSEMLLGGGEMLWQNLAALLNVCWEEEFIPVDWMDGIVVPLHKGGGGIVVILEIIGK